MKKILAAFLSLSLLAGCSASVGDQMYEKYGSIIDALEEENYEAAMQEIAQMKKDKLIAEAGDINDYLTTVRITNDNLFEYFEPQYEPRYNSFGELEEDAEVIILRSKKYDEGLVLYDMNALNSIKVEIKSTSYDHTYEMPLLSLLSGFTYFGDRYEITRLTDGDITYISNEYIQSKEVTQPVNETNGVNTVKITFNDGSVLMCTEKEGYPY